jgi:hypothetical protein
MIILVLKVVNINVKKKDYNLLPKNYIDDEENECFVKKIKRVAPKKAGKALELD